MSKNKKKSNKNKTNEKLQVFWAFNIINILTFGGIMSYLFIYFCEPFPVEAYHIGVFAIIQATMSFVLNLIVYKNVK